MASPTSRRKLYPQGKVSEAALPRWQTLAQGTIRGSLGHGPLSSRYIQGSNGAWGCEMEGERRRREGPCWLEELLQLHAAKTSRKG